MCSITIFIVAANVIQKDPHVNCHYACVEHQVQRTHLVMDMGEDSEFDTPPHIALYLEILPLKCSLGL